MTVAFISNRKLKKSSLVTGGVIPASRIRDDFVQTTRKPFSVDAVLKRFMIEGICGKCRSVCCTRYSRIDVRPSDPNFEQLLAESRVHKATKINQHGAFQLPIDETTCRFLGEHGCTLPTDSRSEICNVYPFKVIQEHSVDRFMLDGSCPIVGNLAILQGITHLYLDELATVVDGAVKPRIPLLGNALISLLRARTALYSNNEVYFDNSAFGPLVEIVMPSVEQYHETLTARLWKAR